MIVFINGDILKTKADAIVNPVNCEGVMGKGLAYQIKIKYPKTYEAYSLACKQGELQTGKIHSFFVNDKLIINFPTKNKWREKSKMDYVTSGLDELVEIMLK